MLRRSRSYGLSRSARGSSCLLLRLWTLARAACALFGRHPWLIRLSRGKQPAPTARVPCPSRLLSTPPP